MRSCRFRGVAKTLVQSELWTFQDLTKIQFLQTNNYYSYGQMSRPVRTRDKNKIKKSEKRVILMINVLLVLKIY